MTVSIISVTEKGRRLSGKISVILSEKHTVSRYCFYKKSDDASTPFNDINVIVSDIFENSDAIEFICACWIAVRSVASFVKSKQSDPAVIVIDDCGKYAIPILSGHIGGANHLAEFVADNIGAVPVITTATDIGGRFSPDSFARANGLIITDINAAKAIAAAVLDGEKIGLCSEYQCKNIPSEFTQNESCRIGIYIGTDISKKPFETTLCLVPRNICIGIGCKRGTSLADIRNRINSVMPTIAECGGFMYLHDIMEDNDGKAYKTSKLRRFGYIKMTVERDNILCKKYYTFPVHEFHYWDSTLCGEDFTAEKSDGRSWKCAYANENMYAGFPHLYFYSDIKMAKNFVRRCLEYGEYNG